MPTETKIAARSEDGSAIFYSQATIPSPEVVASYERFCPGAANIMLNMAVEEQKIDLYVRERNSRLEFAARLMGMVFAFVLALSMICGGILLIIKGHNVSGCITLFTSLLGIVGCLASGGKTPPGK